MKQNRETKTGKRLAPQLILLIFITAIMFGSTSCATSPKRPETKNDLEVLKWGTHAEKKKTIVRLYKAKKPGPMIKLIEDTLANVPKKRSEDAQDPFYYDNHEEQVWTIRFIGNVLSKLEAKKAAPALIKLAGSPLYSDRDKLAPILEKALHATADAEHIPALIEAGAEQERALTHKELLLKTAARLTVIAKQKPSSALLGEMEKLLESDQVREKSIAFALVGILDYKPAREQLVRSTKSTDRELKKQACLALVKLGDVRGVTPLLDLHREKRKELIEIARLVEKEGFADEVRLYLSRLEQKKFEKQTSYLQKKGIL